MAGVAFSQACATLVQRGADIPGRAFDGGQATDDRNDRSVLVGHLACFRQISRVLGGLGVGASSCPGGDGSSSGAKDGSSSGGVDVGG